MVVHQAIPQLIHQLERFYAFEPPVEGLHAYLAEDPDLVPVLLAAIEPIKELFGASTHCTIAVEYDPEDDDPPPHVFVTIRSPRSDDEVEQALETFDETWWWDHARGTGDRLTFDVRLA